MHCLDGDRGTLRTPEPRTAQNAAEPPDMFEAMSDGSAALLFAARKTGWPPPVPAATAGPNQ